ncbi:hypothetical protein KAI65_02430 [Candidatus Parcubacteria bacterium]|nr:hypothetical protein [Candidatus Parcubacteria bacterium]
MKKIIKRIFGEVILVGGIGILFYNIFNFSHEVYYEKVGLVRRELEGIAYYYNLDTLLMIAISAMLIVAGILIIKNK